MALECISPPVVEPVSLAELKEFLRLDAGDTSQDGTITELALDARAWCETFTARRFVKQGWRLSMDFFPGYIDLKLAGTKVSSPFVSGSNAVLVGIRYAVVLPYPPVRSIDLFQYQDGNGHTTAMVDGVDFIKDLRSNPARLTPPFGQMWPVARVVVNAIELDYTLGYAQPIQVNTNGSTVTAAGSPPNYLFQATDLGRPIWIPGAGTGGKDLNTILSAVTGAPASTATLRDASGTAVNGVTALLVNAGIPAHWPKIKRGIKVMTFDSYYRRSPRAQTEDTVQRILYPVRDLR
jgi:hypothetical protein